MRHCLVVYASTHGHTAKIAGRIAARLRSRNLDVELHNVSAGAGAASLDADIAIVMGSVHREHHQRELVDWVKSHRMSLAALPAAFISVSLTAAEDTVEARTATRKMTDDFVEDTGWTPTHTFCVAGALQYREYDFFTRTLMRLLMRHGGHPTDISQDYDYTDWDGVDQIADELAGSLAAEASPR